MKTFKKLGNVFKKVSAILTFAAVRGISLFAQDFDPAAKLTAGVSQVKTMAKTLSTYASIFLFIVGAILVVWAFFRRNKGDGQANDSLASLLWGIGIVLVIMLLLRIFFLN